MKTGEAGEGRNQNIKARLEKAKTQKDKIRRSEKEAKKQMKMTGKIYIMTYSKDEGVVKIGFTTGSVEDRADELNRPTGVVGIYEPYASLETSEDHADKELHAWIDAINSDARVVDYDKNHLNKACGFVMSFKNKVNKKLILMIKNDEIKERNLA